MINADTLARRIQELSKISLIQKDIAQGESGGKTTIS
jgi:hypothetical protein